MTACPYIALVCKGIHNHPPPPPDRTPVGIKDELQTMIQNIISSDNSVTPGSIIAGKVFKLYDNMFTTLFYINIFYLLNRK